MVGGCNFLLRGDRGARFHFEDEPDRKLTPELIAVRLRGERDLEARLRELVAAGADFVLTNATEPPVVVTEPPVVAAASAGPSSPPPRTTTRPGPSRWRRGRGWPRGGCTA